MPKSKQKTPKKSTGKAPTPPRDTAAVRAATAVVVGFGDPRPLIHDAIREVARIIDQHVGLTGLLAAAKAVLALDAKEARMRAEYPPGSCNAEDAWRDFGKEQGAAWKDLRDAVAKAEGR